MIVPHFFARIARVGPSDLRPLVLEQVSNTGRSGQTRGICAGFPLRE